MWKAKLVIEQAVWDMLIKQLHERGMGERESGAFLLGLRSTNEISSFICYDDLDPKSLDTGIIVFNGNGYIKLWKHCSAHNLQVLADIHTHPGKWTAQSGLDKEHPMILQKGHIALIVPDFACKKQQTLKGIGVHEFLGDRRWKEQKLKSRILKIVSNGKH